MVQHFLAGYGLVAIFVLMLAESACVPIPSELIMLFGGALAAGAVPGAHPRLVLVVAAGVLGNVAGSYLAWAVGRYGGQAALRRWGRYVWLREHDIVRAQRWFARYGAVSVLVGRLLPVVRTFVSLPAGIAAMAPARFGVYTFLGCLPWTAALAGTGYAIGAHWSAVAEAFHGPSVVIACALAVLAVVAVVVFVRGRRGATAPRP